MRRQIAIHQLVYNHLYPNPSSSDPPGFTAHLARNLVPEVRIEVATFYGDLNSVEARYPGLNYCYAPHRLRLGRFKHHRRLFNAFDALGLTEQEIQDLCCWEGSKWARQKYEEDQGEKVIDTTGDEIGPWIDARNMSPEDKSRLWPSRKLLNGLPLDRSQPAQDISALYTSATQSSADSQPSMTAVPPRLPSLSSSTTRRLVPSTPSSSASTTSRELSERSRTLLLRLEEQVVRAWQSGRPLSPELEALVKDRVERGHLPSDFLIQPQSLASQLSTHDVIHPESFGSTHHVPTT